VTDDGPIAAGDGHDSPGLIDERVPCIAAMIDDVVDAFEDSVRQPILSHELPDILLAVELGRPRRQLQERYVSGNLEVLRSVPAGLIEEEDRVGAGADFCGDFVQMKLMASVLQKGLPLQDRETGAALAVATARTIAAAMMVRIRLPPHGSNFNRIQVRQ
jgi:hypothetical protein